MQIRITQKLAKKIKVKTLSEPDGEVHPYLDWVARLFTFDRIQYILITHRSSLLSTVIYGRGINTSSAFTNASQIAIKECLSFYHFDSIFQDLINPSFSSPSITKVNDRRVNGCMTELVYNAQWDLHDYRASTPLHLMVQLNGIIQCSLEHKYPTREFEALGQGM